MPNRSSKAGHVPQRTCVICRMKAEKKKLLKFMLMNSEVVFVMNNEIGKRGYYVCNDNNCLQKVDKRVLKMVKRRRING